MRTLSNRASESQSCHHLCVRSRTVWRRAYGLNNPPRLHKIRAGTYWGGGWAPALVGRPQLAVGLMEEIQESVADDRILDQPGHPARKPQFLRPATKKSLELLILKYPMLALGGYLLD